MWASHAHTLGSPVYNGLPFGPVLLKKGSYNHGPPSPLAALNYTLFAERQNLEQGLEQRLFFNPDNTPPGVFPSTISRMVNANINLQNCQDFTVYIQVSLIPIPLSLNPAPLSLIPVPLSLNPIPLSLIPVSLSLNPAPLSLIPRLVYKTLMFFTDIFCRMASVISSMGLHLIWRSPRSS